MVTPPPPTDNYPHDPIDDVAFRVFAKHYHNSNSNERNKNAIILTKQFSVLGTPIDQNALRLSEMKYGLLCDYVIM